MFSTSAECFSHVRLLLEICQRTEAEKQTNLMASHSLEVTYRVTDGIHSHMAHVQAPRWVWKHREDIKLFLLRTLEQKKLKKEV